MDLSEKEIVAKLDFLEADLRSHRELLKNIQEKYVPVSESNLNKRLNAVLETMDDFTQMTVDFQGLVQQQNLKIASLDKKVQGLQQQTVMMAVASQQQNDVNTVVSGRLRDIEEQLSELISLAGTKE